MESEGLEFYPVGLSLDQPELLAKTFHQLGQLTEIAALQYSLNFCQLFTKILAQYAPKAITKIPNPLQLKPDAYQHNL